MKYPDLHSKVMFANPIMGLYVRVKGVYLKMVLLGIEKIIKLCTEKSYLPTDHPLLGVGWVTVIPQKCFVTN